MKPTPTRPPAPPTAHVGSMALWQLPTALLCLVVVPLTRAAEPRSGTLASAVAGAAVIVVVTVVALAVPTRWWTPTTRALVPFADLVGAALVYGYAHSVLPSALLLVALPVAWLCFDFGPVGAFGATGAVVLVSVWPHLVDPDLPFGRDQRIDLVVPPLAAAGIGIVVSALGRTLQRTQDELLAHARELEQQVATLNGIVQAVDVAVGVFVPGRPPVRNLAAERLIRRAGSAPEDPRSGDRFYGADRVTPLPVDDRVLVRALRGDTFSGVLQWVGPPDDQAAMVCSAHQVRDDDGVLLATVVAGWDATELLDAVRLREEIVANVSHELRTPLTSIAGYLELLVEGLEDLPVDTAHLERMSAVMRRNSVHLERRIEQLLAVAESEGVTVSRRPVDVVQVVCAALAKHEEPARSAGLRLTHQHPPTATAVVDPVAVEQVVDALVSNAVKYTPRGGAVTVRLDADDHLVLVVADTGSGMDEVHRQHAFDRFYRGETATRNAVPGIGLGLAITQHLVRLHDGTVELESAPGRGTCVTVRLPARVPASGTEGPSTGT